MASSAMMGVARAGIRNNALNLNPVSKYLLKASSPIPPVCHRYYIYTRGQGKVWLPLFV
jgi:hypothetical protein